MIAFFLLKVLNIYFISYSFGFNFLVQCAFFIKALFSFGFRSDIGCCVKVVIKMFA